MDDCRLDAQFCGSCFVIAMAVFAASVIISWILNRFAKKKGGFFTPMRVLFLGVFLASTALMFPSSYLQQNDPGLIQQGLRGLSAVFVAGQYAVRWFLLDGDHELLLAAVHADWEPWFYCLGAVLLVVAPALTFTVVINFFKNITSGLSLMGARYKDVYVFSALTPRSLALAQDLRKNHPRAVLIFTDLSESSEGGEDLEDGAAKIKAICFRRDILAMNFGFQRKNKQLSFFVIGEDERENMTHALALSDRYGDRDNTNLYVFSRGLENEVLLASAQRKAMKIRRINHVRNLISRNLYEQGQLLFEEAVPAENGEKQIGAVVVGMGAHGSNMVRALSWYCQMDGYHISIDAFDRDSLALERFSAQCPELMSPEHNGVRNPGEAEYTIRIHPDCCVSTKRFMDLISGLHNTTYVFVALGSDEENIKAALKLRMLFARQGLYPRIQAVVYDSEKKEALRDIRNFKGQPYRIDCIGDLNSTYTEKVILSSALEEDALRRHLQYAQQAADVPRMEKEFWEYEYNYRSSVATAIHAKARIFCGIPGAGKSEKEVTEYEKKTIQDLEHRRWNAYMRSEGFVYSGSPDPASRNDLAKMHHNLVPFRSLSKADQNKDSAVSFEEE